VKLARTIAIVVCAGLLLAGAFGSMRHAYAQDAEEIDHDAGAWNEGGTGIADIDGADEPSPEAKQPPLDIQGCWGDFGEGGGFIVEFNQNGNGTKLEGSSTYKLGLDGGKNTGAAGKLKGSVSSTGLKFRGRGIWSNGIFVDLQPNCLISGSGTGDASQLMIQYEFRGACRRFFGRKPVSISLTRCQ
jgi:hypothetical protein